MVEQQVQAIVQANGSQLLGYEEGRSAFLILPSGEHVLISIGILTAKVFVRRPIFGWFFPKTIASQRIAAWQPSYPRLDRLRFICGDRVLNGLIELVSRCPSLSVLQSAWRVLSNPFDVGVLREVHPSEAPEGTFPPPLTRR